MAKYISLFVFIIVSCELIKTDILMSSFNIETSKKLKVFEASFVSSVDIFKVNETNFKLKEIWIEKSWCYKNQKKDIKIYNDKSLYLKFDKGYNEIDFLGKFYFKKNGNGIKDHKASFDIDKDYTDTIEILFIPTKMDTLSFNLIKN